MNKHLKARILFLLITLFGTSVAYAMKPNAKYKENNGKRPMTIFEALSKLRLDSKKAAVSKKADEPYFAPIRDRLDLYIPQDKKCDDEIAGIFNEKVMEFGNWFEKHIEPCTQPWYQDWVMPAFDGLNKRSTERSDEEFWQELATVKKELREILFSEYIYKDKDAPGSVHIENGLHEAMRRAYAEYRNEIEQRMAAIKIRYTQRVLRNCLSGEEAISLREHVDRQVKLCEIWLQRT
jgi:hypothetical protein